MHSGTRRFPALGLALVLALGLTSCGKSDDKHVQAEGVGRTVDTPPPGATQVLVKGFRYQPPKVQITRGHEVVWLFEDGQVTHDVKGPGFQSPLLPGGGKWAFRFDNAGTFNYICSVHSYMKGIVEVR
jgi:plastocyanin